jgi:DNA-binding MarR family transcriptional regulator
MSKSESVPFGVTLKVRDTCLCLHARRAARALARRYDEALRPLQITNGQFSLMMALNRPDPPAMGPVASLLAMDRTTLTANLKPLERRGLVKVVADPTDRRSRRMMLTEEGQRLLAAALPLWERMQADVEVRVRSDPDALRADLLALS